jgi:hypothetical protein
VFDALGHEAAAARERGARTFGDRFGVGKQINVGNIATAIALWLTLAGYGSKIVTYLQAVDTKIAALIAAGFA